MPIQSLAFSGDSKRIALGDDDGNVHVVATGGTRSHRVLTGHTDEVHGVDFSRDGTRVVGTSADGSVILWELAGGRRVLHRGMPSWDAAFSPDGSLVLAVGDDGMIRRFDGRTGTTRGVRTRRRRSTPSASAATGPGSRPAARTASPGSG